MESEFYLLPSNQPPQMAPVLQATRGITFTAAEMTSEASVQSLIAAPISEGLTADWFNKPGALVCVA